MYYSWNNCNSRKEKTEINIVLFAVLIVLGKEEKQRKKSSPRSASEDNGTATCRLRCGNESGNARCAEGTTAKNWHDVARRAKSHARLDSLVCWARVNAHLNDHVPRASTHAPPPRRTPACVSSWRPRCVTHLQPRRSCASTSFVCQSGNEIEREQFEDDMWIIGIRAESLVKWISV